MKKDINTLKNWKNWYNEFVNGWAILGCWVYIGKGDSADPLCNYFHKSSLYARDKSGKFYNKHNGEDPDTNYYINTKLWNSKILPHLN